MWAAVGMNKDALLQPGREDSQGEGILLGWLHPEHQQEQHRHTAGSNFTSIPVALNFCLHTSSLAANSAKSAQNPPCHHGNLGRYWKQGAVLPVPDG